jgi:hypothetical protein
VQVGQNGGRGGGAINIYRKHSTKYETVAMIQDKLVAKLSRVMTTYGIIGICRFPKSVANSDRWPTYKDGKIQRFYCTLKKFFPTDFPIKILFEFFVNPLRLTCTANLTDLV